MAHSPTPWKSDPVSLSVQDAEGTTIAKAVEGDSRLETLDNLHLMAMAPTVLGAALRFVREYRQFVLPGGALPIPMDMLRAIETLERAVEKATER